MTTHPLTPEQAARLAAGATLLLAPVKFCAPGDILEADGTRYAVTAVRCVRAATLDTETAMQCGFQAHAWNDKGVICDDACSLLAKWWTVVHPAIPFDKAYVWVVSVERIDE